jgi:hypothetical protein
MGIEQREHHIMKQIWEMVLMQKELPISLNVSKYKNTLI